MSERARIEQIVLGRAVNLSFEQKQAFIQSYVDEQDASYPQFLAILRNQSLTDPSFGKTETSSSSQSASLQSPASVEGTKSSPPDLRVSISTGLPTQSGAVSLSSQVSSVPGPSAAVTTAPVIPSASTAELNSTDAQQLLALLNKLPLSALSTEDASSVQSQLESFLERSTASANCVDPK